MTELTGEWQGGGPSPPITARAGLRFFMAPPLPRPKSFALHIDTQFKSPSHSCSDQLLASSQTQHGDLWDPQRILVAKKDNQSLSLECERLTSCLMLPAATHIPCTTTPPFMGYQSSQEQAIEPTRKQSTQRQQLQVLCPSRREYGCP